MFRMCQCAYKMRPSEYFTSRMERCAPRDSIRYERQKAISIFIRAESGGKSVKTRGLLAFGADFIYARRTLGRKRCKLDMGTMKCTMSKISFTCAIYMHRTKLCIVLPLLWIQKILFFRFLYFFMGKQRELMAKHQKKNIFDCFSKCARLPDV